MRYQYPEKQRTWDTFQMIIYLCWGSAGWTAFRKYIRTDATPSTNTSQQIPPQVEIHNP